MPHEIRYAKSGDVNIAYQIIGEGPLDIVLVPGWVSNIDVFWEDPSMARFLQRLASFSRLILFDKRGTGLSDRVTDHPTLEERMDDVRAVMDAIGSEKAALVGYSEGGAMVALFAATYPERTNAMVLIGSFARRLKTEDYPWGPDQQERDAFIETIRQEWGGPVGLEKRAPSKIEDPQFVRWWARLLRASATPATAIALSKMNSEIDYRDVLPTISVPALILHAKGDMTIEWEHGKYLADHIPDARFVLIPAQDHLPWVGAPEFILNEIEEFLTGVRTQRAIDRVLSTLMFTDIVDSTRLATELGDEQWGELLTQHDQEIRREISIYRGKEINTTGDGFFAAFDGPARALYCAKAIRQDMQLLGLSVRIGIHTGECERRGDDMSGIAVNIAARIAALAGPDQILGSRTVRDLVAGSGVQFTSAGSHKLKGVAEEWELFEVE